MRKHRACIQGLISFGLFGVLFGCGSQSDLMLPKPTAGQPSDRTNLPTHTGTAVVSTEGAVISVGAAEVVIPRGALAEPVEIVVQAADTGSFAEIPNAEEEQVLAFLPHGTQFLKPVTIHIPHDHVSVDGLSLFTSEPDQPWSNVAGATFTDEYASADVTHFSFFFASPTPVEEIVVPRDDGNGGAGGSSSTAGSGGSDAVAGAGGEPASGGAAGEGGEGGAAGDTNAAGSAGEGGEAGTSNTSTDPDAGPGLAGAGGSTAGEGGGAGTTATPRPDAGVAGGGSGEGGEGGYAGSSAGAGGGAGSPGTGGSGGATSGGGDDYSYADNGVWHGYMYEFADAASDITRTGSCVAGLVAAGPSSYALWGWNVNQEEGSESFSSWDPNAESLFYDIDVPFGERLVLQLIDDQDVTYCVAVEAGGYGEVQLSDFSTDCWGSGGGTFYNGTPIAHTQVVVPSQAEEEQPFDFCVYDIRPLARDVDPGGPDAGAGGSAGSGGGTSTGGSAGASTGMGGGAGSAGSAGATSGGGDDGYADNGVWHGYTYEFADPASDITRTGNCVVGEVGAGPSSYALWGWNVNQEEGSESFSSWDPNAESLRYSIDVLSGERLVLQLIDDEGLTYCAPVEEGGFGEAQLADFSTDCWGSGGGTLYNGAPIVHTQVLVPSQAEAVQPFDFCVYDIRPQVGYVDPGGGPDAGAGGSFGVGGGTSTGGSAGMGGTSSGGSAGSTSGGGDDYNYADNGVWHGYMYEFADPASDITRTGSCVEGTVAAGPSGGALWGWNVNQEESGSSSSWDPNAESLRYDIDARSGERLVLQLIDDQDVTYCLALEEGFYFGEAQLADFSTDCWGSGDGTFYNGTPIVRTQVAVPSQAEEEQPFDFCVYDIRPQVGYVDPGGGPDAGAGGSFGVGGGTSTGGSGGASTGMGGGAGSAGSAGATSGGGDDGYADNGVWHGYTYEFADPASDITRTGNCVVGEVGAGPSSYALWGWNVNQEEGSESFSSWDPNAESLRYSIDVLSGERLVLQLIDDEGLTYCAPIEEGGFGEAQLADFSTDCWGSGGGTLYNGAPIVHTQVLVPSQAEAVQPFDFCVYDIRPQVGYVDPGGGPDAGAGGSFGVGGGTSTGGSGGASTGGAAGGPGGGDDYNYADNGVWHGYMYEFADPASDITRTGSCVAGELGAGPSSVALWGWNVNQDESGSLSSWDPNAESLRYEVDSLFGERLVLQLIDDQQETYCLALEEGSYFGEAQLADFSTDCWGSGDGTFYNGAPIERTQVLVPNPTEQAQPFDFCVYDIRPQVGYVDPGGGPDAGAGGSAGAGTGGGASTGGAAGGPGGGDVSYLDEGEWHGYLYTANDAMSDIERFGMCAQGTVGQGETNFALWGWNVNQEEEGTAIVDSWAPTSDAIRYGISAFEGEPLRLQVVDIDNQAFCRIVDEPFGVAPLSEFNTACWDRSGNSGAYYAGLPIRTVQVLVPGNSNGDQPFDMCVDELSPFSAGGGTGPDAGAGAGGSGGASGGQDAGVPD